MKKKKILLIGNYGAGNIGDEAILESLLKLCKVWGCEPIVMSGNPGETRQKYKVISVPFFASGFRSFFKKNSELKKYLKKIDFAILGGGGLFQDNDSTACWIWYRQILGIRRHKIPYACLGQSVSPLRHFFSRFATRYVMNNAERIIMRDHESVAVLHTLGITRKISTACDLALLDTDLSTKKYKNKTVAISLRRWDNIEKITEVLSEFLPKNFKKIILMPMGDDDKEILKSLAKKLPQKSTQIAELHTPLDAKNILKKCDFLIGMRLHSGILASSVGTPALMISYDEKVKSFAKFADFPYLELGNISQKSLQNKTKNTSFSVEKLTKKIAKSEKIYTELF